MQSENFILSSIQISKSLENYLVVLVAMQFLDLLCLPSIQLSHLVRLYLVVQPNLFHLGILKFIT